MRILQGAKYLWTIPDHDGEAVCLRASAYNLSLPLVQTLFTRGMTSSEQFDRYLFSSYEQDVAHPGLLKDAEKAIDRLVKAIEQKEKILIAGDYDVDGITSSALLLICLLPLGADINFFLPNRVRDGYGLSVKTVQRAAQNGYTVIITVDNGITAFEPAREAQKLGIDLIITDHHRPHDHLPEAYAVVDPHREDCEYPYKKFAGVGVSFKLMALLYERLGMPLPEKVYELLLLGTVADVVPLTGENRFWVRHGLQLINNRESFSLQVLKKNARVTKPQLSSTDIGFFITPQINALGRLEDARAGVKFLIGSDTQETELVGQTLAQLNEARKNIERSIFSEIEALVIEKTINLDEDKILIASSNKWPSGVIGLVASRLVGAYGRPAILFHITSDGLAKGSCRSIPEFNIFEALCEVKDLLHTFGGHPMAAGLSLKVELLPELKQRLNKLLAERLKPEDFKQKLRIDGELTLPEANKKLLSDMALCEPFGCENPQPVFYVKQVSLIDQPQLLKDAHIKCMVFADGVIKPVIIFNRPDLYEPLCRQGQAPFDIAVQVIENQWNGRINVELQALDVAGVV